MHACSRIQMKYNLKFIYMNLADLKSPNRNRAHFLMKQADPTTSTSQSICSVLLQCCVLVLFSDGCCPTSIAKTVLYSPLR